MMGSASNPFSTEEEISKAPPLDGRAAAVGRSALSFAKSLDEVTAVIRTARAH